MERGPQELEVEKEGNEWWCVEEVEGWQLAREGGKARGEDGRRGMTLEA